MFLPGQTTNMFDFKDAPAVLKGTVTPAGLAARFAGCADLVRRSLRCGKGGAAVSALWLDGLTDARAVSEEVIRPLFCPSAADRRPGCRRSLRRVRSGAPAPAGAGADL